VLVDSALRVPPATASSQQTLVVALLHYLLSQAITRYLAHAYYHGSPPRVVMAPSHNHRQIRVATTIVILCVSALVLETVYGRVDRAS
jgi:hypothetical protein